MSRGGLQKLCAYFSTVGPAGYSPIAPGTTGALAALPIAWIMRDCEWWCWAAVIVPLTLISVFTVSVYIKNKREKDPNEVVIDEFVGCLIAAAFVPGTVVWQIAAFLFFRLFDIVKPWPIGIIDKKVKNAWGVMGDDVGAGIMAGLMLLVINFVLRWQHLLPTILDDFFAN